ncbi:MAG TPA: hypothetical protein VLB46_18780 [Pyrinomonadaceae bacterium]|nr:hypothetical protein [Pyrinomonadaceae bacterium]
MKKKFHAKAQRRKAAKEGLKFNFLFASFAPLRENHLRLYEG